MEQFGKRFLKNVLLFVVSFGGSGLISKKMPGTIGSLFATFISAFFIYSNPFGLLFVLSLLLGIFCSNKFIIVEKFDENRDPSYIVIDEACGIFLGAWILKSFGYLNISQLFLNFALFRIFDILKPFPISQIERYLKKSENTAAFGIMFDDILAAIFATTIQIFILKLFNL